MFYFKIITFTLLAVGLLVSCKVSGNSEIVQPNALNNNLNVSRQNINNEPNDNQIITKSENSSKPEKESFSQDKPRRKSIKYPNDCTTSIPAGEENWQLQESCAVAIKQILPYLPKTTGIGLSSEKLSCNYNNLEDESNWNDNRGVEFYPIFSNKYLVKISCLTGAYNEINTYLLYDESSLPAKAEVLSFPGFEFEYPAEENTDIPKSVKKVFTKTVGGRYFNPKTKELIVFVKARGIGDAGHYARYSFPNGKPKLLEFRAKFKWDGKGYQTDDVIKQPPQAWKRYYP